MAIPLSYNVRNLKLRKGLTVMTALGIALTVTTAVFLMALLAGLDKAFATSGDALNVLVMRKGSTAELSGGFDASLFPTLGVSLMLGRNILPEENQPDHSDVVILSYGLWVRRFQAHGIAGQADKAGRGRSRGRARRRGRQG